MSRTKKYFNSAVTTLVLSMFSAQVASSGVVTGPLNVSASVVDSCSVNVVANNLSFGNYDPTSAQLKTVTGSLSVRCNKGTEVTSIGLDNGLHSHRGQRQMQGAEQRDSLEYNIFQPVGASFGPRGESVRPGTCTTLGASWGDDDGNLLKFREGSGKFPDTRTSTISVCGQIPTGQGVSSDNYSDTVVITVNFT